MQNLTLSGSAAVSPQMPTLRPARVERPAADAHLNELAYSAWSSVRRSAGQISRSRYRGRNLPASSRLMRGHLREVVVPKLKNSATCDLSAVRAARGISIIVPIR